MIFPAFKAGGPSARAGGRWVRLPYPSATQTMGRRKEKRRPRQIDPGKQARRLARALLGSPPAERVLPAKKKERVKHKKRDLERELE